MLQDAIKRLAEEGLLNWLCSMRPKYLPNDLWWKGPAGCSPYPGRKGCLSQFIRVTRNTWYLTSITKYWCLSSQGREDGRRGCYRTKLPESSGNNRISERVDSSTSPGGTVIMSRQNGVAATWVAGISGPLTADNLSRYMGIRKGYWQFIQWLLLRHGCCGGCGSSVRRHNLLPSCWTLASFQVWSPLSEGEAESQAVWPLKHHDKSVCSVMSNSATPRTAAQCSSVLGVSQTRILEWIDISFSRGSSWPRDWTCISCLGRQQICYYWATWEAPYGMCIR